MNGFALCNRTLTFRNILVCSSCYRYLVFYSTRRSRVTFLLPYVQLNSQSCPIGDETGNSTLRRSWEQFPVSPNISGNPTLNALPTDFMSGNYEG